MAELNKKLIVAAEAYFADLRRVRASGGGTGERSYYPALAGLLGAVGATLKPKVFCVLEGADQGAGHPDVRYLETVHTNGVKSFWSMLKRAHKGTFHRLSAKHLQRYVDEFAAKQNIRDMDTIRQMEYVVARLVGQRLLYRELVA